MAKLIIGCGYLGSRVADRWLSAGETVHVVTRSVSRADQFSGRGLKPIVARITDAASIPRLPAVDTVLFAVGFDRREELTIEQVYVGGLANTLPQLDNDCLERFIYVSSTGVYGQTSGEWVDEASECQPATVGGRACLNAERRLTDSGLASKAIVLRLAGLYGPGRVPRRESILKGEAIASSPDGYLNLIHVDDAARIAADAHRLPVPSRFVVADQQPVERRRYFEDMAELLGAPAPQFVAPNAESGRDRRGASNKRVCNSKLLEALPFDLQFPTYKAGLEQIFEAG